MNDSPQFMTKSQYATYKQVAKSYVSKLAGQGRLVLAPDGRVDVVATDALLKSSTGAPERAADTVNAPEFVDHKERGEKYKAELLEMDVAERRGTLLRVDDVRATVVAAITGVRSGLEGLPDRLAPQLAAASDESAVRTMLAVEIEALLADLSHQFNRFAAAQE